MTYLVFDTQMQAQTALAQIWSNMQPIVEMNACSCQQVTPITERWAVEAQRLDGKWVFAKPYSEHMTNVTDYTDEEYSKEWFEVSE